MNAYLSEPISLIIFVTAVLLISMWVAPRQVTVGGFYQGASLSGQAPSLWVLVLSQVTTWIFARSLMNAAILGYFYGFAGTLAYTLYYLSFLTGLFIIDQLRNDQANSVQDWLAKHFGHAGRHVYNFVISLRLVSELFANLIVVGLIFSAAFPEQSTQANVIAILGFAVAACLYSALGGLCASLRTDVMQMLIFLLVLIIAFIVMVGAEDFHWTAIITATGVSELGSYPGWILCVVALLQVLSYPAHDPVMMDRGFISDKRTTRRSFFHAFWLSSICIFGFGMFGIQASIIDAQYDNQLLGTWQMMFGPGVYFLIIASLLISALSTLDSALASSSRLVIDEFKLASRTVMNGRIVMVMFMSCGVLLTFWDNKTLFDAVAVSGTASMFLAPILIYALIFKRIVPLWSYLFSSVTAFIGAAAYLYREAQWVQMLFGQGHKYEQLLSICISVLILGLLSGLIGIILQSRKI